MKWFFVLISCFACAFTHAESDTFSKDRLTAFYDAFFCEEKQDLSNAGITSSCTSITPTPPIPEGTVPPAPVSGYFAVVISNGTGQPDDQVYFLGLPNANADFFTLSGAFPGALSTVPVTPTTFSASSQFSYPLTSLPKSTTGPHDYLIYVPYGNSDRLYFSIGNPLYFLSNNGSATPSIGNNFYDPNYNVLFDFAEVTFQPAAPPAPGDIDWTATVDTTQVDSLSLSIKLGFYSYNAAQPTAVTPFIGGVGTPATNPVGFDIARDTLINNIVTGLTSDSATGTWANLAKPFYTDPYSPTTPTTYLRVMAPKHGGTLPQPGANYQIPEFPGTYLTNNGNGFNYLDTIFNFYTGGTSLYIQTDAGGGSGEIYQGSVSGNIFTFTGQTHPTYTVTLDKTALTIENMFSGTPPMTNTGSTPTVDVGIMANYFSSAFVVGLLGVTGLYDSIGTPLSEANLNTHLPTNSGGQLPAYYTNSFSSPSTSKPGYDLYAQLLHDNAILPMSPPFNNPYPTLGLCYGYDFDDTLGFSSAITPPDTTPSSTNVYAIITLGAVSTLPTGVFDDSSTYDLTFTFAAGTFGYRRGANGTFTTSSSPAVINTVTSTSSNPFQIQYNGNIYTVFPKYQFLQPVAQYATAQSAVIQGVTFTPNSATAPTGFTVALP